MIDSQYENALRRILREGRTKSDRTGTGTTAVFDHTLRYDLSQGFPLITTKKVFTKGITHELLWFLKGDTNIKYLVDNGVHIWDEWADANGDLGPVYGAQWRAWRGAGESYTDSDNLNETVVIDQIANLIDGLKSNPFGRRHIVTAWNPAEVSKMALPPCHMLFQFYVDELTLAERINLCNKASREEEAAFRDSPEAMNEFRTYGDIDPFLPDDAAEAHRVLDRQSVPRLRLSSKLTQRSIH